MAVKKKFPIKIGFNLDDVRQDLQKTKDLLREKQRLVESGALPAYITQRGKQERGRHAKTQKNPYKDKKSRGPTSGISPDSIVTELQKKVKDLEKKQKQQQKKIDKNLDFIQDNMLDPFGGIKQRGYSFCIRSSIM